MKSFRLQRSNRKGAERSVFKLGGFDREPYLFLQTRLGSNVHFQTDELPFWGSYFE
jgi:hypothetical protein